MIHLSQIILGKTGCVSYILFCKNQNETAIVDPFQGFEEDISMAISDHYLPISVNSEVPKKLVGSAVALIDKIDILVGFFGINEKPTSSKDPFALRRSAIGLLRIIIESKLSVQLKDLINYSIITYEEQDVRFSNNSIVKDVLFFLKERTSFVNLS